MQGNASPKNATANVREKSHLSAPKRSGGESGENTRPPKEDMSRGFSEGERAIKF